MAEATGPVRPTRVLLVEDDPGNALVMKTILTRLGAMEVEVTEDGDSALSSVEEGGVDVVVMDVSLANTKVRGVPVDGLELARMIKVAGARRGRPTPVLLATAHAMRGDAERFLEATGADGYIAKPILEHRDLVEAVRRVHRTGQGVR